MASFWNQLFEQTANTRKEEASRQNRRRTLRDGRMVRRVFFAVLALGCIATLMISPALADKDKSLQAQKLIDEGKYKQAVQAFTAVIAQKPTDADGYRGRAEALLMLDRYSDALSDYSRLVAYVLPVNSNAVSDVYASYDARLAKKPKDLPALTGACFVHWWSYDSQVAADLADSILLRHPKSVFGKLFRGSSNLFAGNNPIQAVNDLDRAIQLAPCNPHVRFIVSDAYTYALPDPNIAFAQAMLALMEGIDTPRIHAILASAFFAFGDYNSAANELFVHVDLVTSDIVNLAPLASATDVTIHLVPRRTFSIPVGAAAGDVLSIVTNSPSGEISDSIVVLLAPDGTPVFGNDDFNGFYAGFDWTVSVAGTYELLVTSFESIGTGQLVVTRN